MKKKALILRLTTPLLLAMLALITIAVPPLTRGERAVLRAVEKLGCRYVLRADGPKNFDCSGLVKYCYSPLGIDLVHHAETVGYDNRYPKLVFPFQFAVGDLVFFDTVSSDKDKCDHVGIWMGANRFIHASSSAKKVVISELDGYYREKFSWGRRVAWPFF